MKVSYRLYLHDYDLEYHGFPNHLATTESVYNLAVVAHIDKALQAFLQRVFVRIQHRIVNHQRVKLIAWFEAAHLAADLVAIQKASDSVRNLLLWSC